MPPRPPGHYDKAKVEGRNELMLRRYKEGLKYGAIGARVGLAPHEVGRIIRRMLRGEEAKVHESGSNED